jgi:hypothetical protein
MPQVQGQPEPHDRNARRLQLGIGTQSQLLSLLRRSTRRIGFGSGAAGGPGAITKPHPSRLSRPKPRRRGGAGGLIESVWRVRARLPRRGGRAVECTGLENRQARKGFGSSNLPLSANLDSQTSLSRRKFLRISTQELSSCKKGSAAAPRKGAPASGSMESMIEIGRELPVDELRQVSATLRHPSR